jgi:N-methylhydantoinase A/oxoprolinase/acetone carboxylase beta subunit
MPRRPAATSSGISPPRKLVAPIEEGYVIGDEFSGQPMQLPVVDIVEVGAGGGSLAWCDAGGGLHVGPVPPRP